MSDLQCAATLLVVRHGDAEDDGPGLVSDADRQLTALGQQQGRDLGARLAGERVAAVYTSTLQRASATGAEVAVVLGVDARPVEGLQEFSVGGFAGQPEGADGVTAVFARWLDGALAAACPGAESGADVLARYRAALGDIADQHRGETVVVVSHGGVMSLCLPLLCDNVSDDLARARWIPNCGMATVLVDADGWVLCNWPGVEPVPPHDGPPPVAEAPAAVSASE